MKTKLLLMSSLMLLGIMIFMFSCKKGSSNPSGGTSLRILKSPQGQNQGISANIDTNGYTNFNAQTILADGGSPLRNYDWSIEYSPTPPAGITIGAQTGVINRIGTSSTGLKVGTTSFKVTVSDGSATRTETVDLIITNYTPGPAAVLQQLHTGFQLKDGEANKAYGASLFVMGGIPPYSWKLDNTYPGSVDLTNAGLTVDGTGGIVWGSIMNSASGKIIKFKIIVTDKAGDVAVYSPVYTINVK
jgi:hypothetical protein